MARSIWSGAISFGLVNVPVKLYTAVSRKTVHFHQLHDADGARIQQKRVCSKDGEEVPYENIVKGYEVSPGQYVVVEPAELDALDPAKTRTIEVEQFVDPAEIDPMLYDQPYWVVPVPGAAKAYRLMLRAMADAQKVAIGRVVLRQKGHLVALRPHGDLLTMETMIYADEVVPADSLEEETTATGDQGRRPRARGRAPADRDALRALRSRALPRRPSRRRARADRAQGRRRGDRDRARAGRRRARARPDGGAAGVDRRGRQARRGDARRRRPRQAGAQEARQPARALEGPHALAQVVTRGRASDRLASFQAKRDFAKTPEPRGGEEGAPDAGGAPRFVIHEHSARRMHWDLRLEHDGVLVSWALPRGLPERPKVNHIAPHTEDHPLEYLDFEAEIPKGSYGAGTIRIWDRGTYDELKWEPRKVEVALHGERVEGRYALFAIGEGERDWMIHRMDAGPAVEPMPDRVVPMLARAGTLPARDDGWAYEVKWDGVRAIAYCEPGPCACAVATCSRSPRATPSSRASPARSAPTARFSTGRSSRSTSRAPELRDARRAHNASERAPAPSPRNPPSRS